MKLLKEKWLSIVQSASEKGENEVGGSSTVTWCHYLQGTNHPVTLLMDHKNLTYFHQPQKLSHRQA